MGGRPRAEYWEAGMAGIEFELLDAVGVPLVLGQRVVYATAGIHSTGQLVPGTIVSLRRNLDDDEPHERIGIRRDDGLVVYIRWSKRVVVLRQESEAEGWLRRQLAQLRG
jgi:hypothetical protein